MQNTLVKKVDWFQDRSDDAYRHEAKNILDSYAHPWDVLVELAQNAVDAITEKRRHEPGFKNGMIQITIDRSKRSVTIRDNGIGIAPQTMSDVLKPHFSMKKGKSLRGEKGVGLTYIALVGNSFTMTSKANEEVASLHVKGVQSWLRDGQNRPQIEIHKHGQGTSKDSYTEASVSEIPDSIADEDEVDIFSLGIDQISHLLRTRTAIGYTGVLFNENPDPDVEVKVTIQEKDGTSKSQKVPFSYATPLEFIPKNGQVTLDDVERHLKDMRPERIYGKAIHFQKSYTTKAGKTIRAFCCLTSRHVYNRISDDLGLPDVLRVEGGILIATKNMPTGIRLSPPRTGRAGYWPNFFLVLEYDNITLDLGRKSITAPRVIKMLADQASVVFNDVDRYIRLTIREDEGPLDALESQDELQDELSAVKKEQDVKIVDRIKKKVLPFGRVPRQEQDIVAIFTAYLAIGALPYRVLRVSSNYRYDCFLQFTSPKTKKTLTVVGEFKFAGESILKDLEDAKVRYGQLHLLICWTMDEAKLMKAGFIIDRDVDEARDIPGATHRLSFPTSAGVKDQPISVIVLSDLLVVQ